MASYTTNYGLHQWVPEDNFLRMDFNEDFKKIDTAIKTTEEGLRGELNGETDRLDGEVDRLDSAITAAQQTVQKNLDTQVSRLDAAIASTKQTLQTDFDADIKRIETALGQKTGIVYGSYVGNDSTSRQISLGFAPSAVLVMINGYYISWMDNMGYVYCYGGLAVKGIPAISAGSGSYNIPSDEILRCTETGFTVYNKSSTKIYSNTSGNTYHYIAFR